MQFELKNTSRSGRVVYTASGAPREIRAGETRNIELTEGQAQNLKRLADQKSPLLISASTIEAQSILDRAAYRVRKDSKSRRLPSPDNLIESLTGPERVVIRDEFLEPIKPAVEPIPATPLVERTFAEEFNRPRRGRK